jgi:hypothetical protein
MQNIERSKGLPQDFRDDRGQQPIRFGPYMGVVKSNVDTTRQGKIQVWVEAINDKIDENNPKKWTPCSYCPPFYGHISSNSAQTTQTPAATSPSNLGTFKTNPVSYGMWFPVPDIGVTVLVFFLNGDASKAIYTGVIPEQATNHMVPAIGSSANYTLDQTGNQQAFASAKRLPVTELNENNEKIQKDPKFFNKPKPIHSVVASQLFKQGLINDEIRGTITSSSQRESPSAVYGISTPGRPIYLNSTNQAAAINGALGTVKSGDVLIVSRQGGHSFVMDDGDIAGKNNLLRLRSSSGHQITMSDDGKAIYITHANGLTWIELGSEGTIDVFSQNSINLRTVGQLNFHADKDININAGGAISIKSGAEIAVESNTDITFKSKAAFTVWSNAKLGLKANGGLTMVSSSGSWNAGGSMSLEAGTINLNGGKTESINEPKNITIKNLPDTSFNSSTGWGPAAKNLETIVTRAPTHEPYLFHNTGVDNTNAKSTVVTKNNEVVKSNPGEQTQKKDVESKDMTPGYAIKQEAAKTVNNADATVPNSVASNAVNKLNFQSISLNLEQALSIDQTLTNAAKSLTSFADNGQLQQLVTQLTGVGSQIFSTDNLQALTSPIVSNLSQAASNLNNLGIGTIAGGDFNTNAQAIIKQASTGLASGLESLVNKDLSSLINGSGIGGILGSQVSGSISDNLGLGQLSASINALSGTDASNELKLALAQLGIDSKNLQNNIGSITSNLSGELTNLIQGAGGGISTASRNFETALRELNLEKSTAELQAAVTNNIDYKSISDEMASLGLAFKGVPNINNVISFEISEMINDISQDKINYNEFYP